MPSFSDQNQPLTGKVRLPGSLLPGGTPLEHTQTSRSRAQQRPTLSFDLLSLNKGPLPKLCTRLRPCYTCHTPANSLGATMNLPDTREPYSTRRASCNILSCADSRLGSSLERNICDLAAKSPAVGRRDNSIREKLEAVPARGPVGLTMDSKDPELESAAGKVRCLPSLKDQSDLLDYFLHMRKDLVRPCEVRYPALAHG